MPKPSCECSRGAASEQHTHRPAHTSSQVGAEHLVLRRVWIRPHRSRPTFDPRVALNTTRTVSDFFHLSQIHLEISRLFIKHLAS